MRKKDDLTSREGPGPPVHPAADIADAGVSRGPRRSSAQVASPQSGELNSRRLKALSFVAGLFCSKS